MGITRNQLKTIVKECLVEILAEGMGSNVSESITEAKRKTSKNSHISSAPATTAAVLRQNASKTLAQSTALKEAIRLEAGGNDIIASILADTAEKTLPTMLENDRMKVPMSTGKIENLVAAHEPEELFGEETTSKWANLAFVGMPKK